MRHADPSWRINRRILRTTLILARNSYDGFSVQRVIERSFQRAVVRVSDWVNNSLLTNPDLTKQWMRNALAFLPNNPLLEIGLAGFEADSRRADFLRSFGLARLPNNSAFCTRAAELLVGHGRPERALSAVDKALRGDPTDLPAQRVRVRILRAIPP
jgi:hypothetical protein